MFTIEIKVRALLKNGIDSYTNESNTAQSHISTETATFFLQIAQFYKTQLAKLKSAHGILYCGTSLMNSESPLEVGGWSIFLSHC